MTSLMRAAAAAALIAVSLAGCSAKSGSTAAGSKSEPPEGSPSASSSAPQAIPSQRPAPVEKNPPGDIPDNVAYVSYHNAAGRYTFVHPEGWASVVRGATATFTDKLNGISAATTAATSPPTVAAANQGDVGRLRSTQPAFELRRVIAARLPGGSGVLIIYRRNSAPDPVTGKVFRDEVERYEIFGHRQVVALELSGPVGADNVDAYRMISQSLRLS